MGARGGLQSLLSLLQAEPLGGPPSGPWRSTCASALSSARLSQHVDALEDMGRAWRALRQTMAAKDSSQCVTDPPVTLCRACTQRAAWGGVNMVSILGTTGSVLAKEDSVLEPLKTIGASAGGATQGRSLVVGRGPDSLLYVFPDCSEAERASCRCICYLP